MDILYEDNHLLAVLKPVGIATMGLPQGEETLLSRARAYVKRKYAKPGNVYLGVVSRLDVPVSGVVLFARTSKAADRINEQFRSRTVAKEYLALVEGRVFPAAAQCVDHVIDDPRHRKMRATQTASPDSKEARLTYGLLAHCGNNSLLRVELETGRKHQIRLQLSVRGFPILGDRKYGAKTILPLGITLHARRLVVRHPTRDETVELVAPVPAFWKNHGVSEPMLASFDP
ncbi:MAG TPA: RNA pseudouridine synthase [Planctomycetaceae bacterium]|nr:RNA pseudouridine synthase [Planctomycetaceae bacterium]